MELYSHETTEKWATAHSEWIAMQGNELALYYNDKFNPTKLNPMSITHEIVDEQIGKIRADSTLSEKSRARRIATWESLRPGNQDEPRIGAGIEADIKAWGNGELKASRKFSDNSLKSANPSADIEEWAHTHTTKQANNHEHKNN